MSTTETVQRVLAEFGIEAVYSGEDGIHSWRCQYPEVYGPCDCLNELLAALQESGALRSDDEQEVWRRVQGFRERAVIAERTLDEVAVLTDSNAVPIMKMTGEFMADRLDQIGVLVKEARARR